ncbi:hypothetical protein B7494_g8022 [Chlorociboria aeruginascens]|nr:hypothetical protein B7494_g8022 [Chlorociboria aeruginascens]
MPARELASSLDDPKGIDVGAMLKTHKVLPRPREGKEAKWKEPRRLEVNPPAEYQDLVIDTGVASMPGSNSSSPHTLKHASKTIGGYPPTPPTHSRQSSASHSISIVAPSHDALLRSSETSMPSTPPNQRSPPTPDVTPPKVIPLTSRPAPRDRYPSSRTDSFKTAREHPYSSDEDENSTLRPRLQSTRASASDIPDVRPRRKAVGLGLGLESDNEGTSTPKGASQQEFVIFDGEWGSTAGEISEVEREWDDNLMRNVTVKKRPRKPHVSTGGQEILEDDIISPTNATKVVRGLPLQEKIARRRLERDLERATSEMLADTISRPLMDPESPTTPDVRRFSAMSGRSTNSTVVEAIVVDGPPQRRKALRHTKKYIGLRDFSDQSTVSSGPNSEVSSEPHPRLLHKTYQIPARGHRSLTSNTTVSDISSTKSRRNVIKSGGIPVIVIPDRRSSTKSSKAPSLRSTSSRKTKRSMSLGSVPLFQSPKFNDISYDVGPRKRTMSESAGSVHTIDFPPVIPTRGSSLSAPTSRNTSRAGSLTAESLKAHNMLQKPVVKPDPVAGRPTVEAPKDLGNQYSRSNFDHNGDPFFGNRPSAQATPFSTTSYETAGTTAVVSEAMAISLYPHQNKSVLVVQHDPQPLSSALKVKAPQKHQPTVAVNGEATSCPATPPHLTIPLDEVDSPFRNPRAPPEPPAIKFIPPTPSELTPTQDEAHQFGWNIDNERPTTSDSKPKLGLSLIRRAFSSRRNSETALPTDSMRRRFSITGRRRQDIDESTQTSKSDANPSTLYPSVVDRPADDSKLHPFWRPSHFWDDLEDGVIGEIGAPFISIRPDPPKRNLSQKLKRTFAILPLDDDGYPPYPSDRLTMRRTPSGNMRVVRRRSSSSLRREDHERRRYEASEPWGYGFKEGNGGKVHTIPGLGVRIEYVGWNGMMRRLSERRREQRSEKLRATISGPRRVKYGMDDVLRRSDA